MSNKVLAPILILLFLCSFHPIALSQEDVVAFPADLNKAIKEGDTNKANELCGDIIFSAEDPAAGARANTVMSIIAFLDVDPDAPVRAESICDFFVDSENPDEKNAANILLYLAGKNTEEKLSEQMNEKSPDWKATATVARYVKNLNDSGINPEKLNTCVKEYMALAEELPVDSWGNAWRVRMVIWHNSLQNPDDAGEGLEKLIIKTKDDVINGPIKEQITAVGNVIELLLKDKKAEAVKSAKKAIASLGPSKNAPKNKPFLHIMQYLSGKKSSIKDVYGGSRANHELFIMASLAVFAKELSQAPDGEIHKSMLVAHLKNYDSNLKNSEQKLVQDWEPRVEKWKEWCSNEFPLSSKLEPLLARHSKVFAEKNKEKLAIEAALKVYDKISKYKKMDKVSISDFNKVRYLFKDRPRPDLMNFSHSDLEKYLKALPLEVQQGEWRRLRYMQTFKDNMAKTLNFSQYDGNITINSKTVRGKVLKADKNYIAIKSSFGTKKYKWSDLPPEQYITFSESYIKNNIGGKVRGKSNIFSSRAATEQALCKEYRLLSIFCDWYGKYPETIKYGKKASSFGYDKGATRQLLLE